jgi:hypothetical protein
MAGLKCEGCLTASSLTSTIAFTGDMERTKQQIEMHLESLNRAMPVDHRAAGSFDIDGFTLNFLVLRSWIDELLTTIREQGILGASEWQMAVDILHLGRTSGGLGHKNSYNTPQNQVT